MLCRRIIRAAPISKIGQSSTDPVGSRLSAAVACTTHPAQVPQGGQGSPHRAIVKAYTSPFDAGDIQVHAALGELQVDKIDRDGVALLGPRGAIDKLATSLENDVDRTFWVQQARVQAIVGSCPSSLASVKSGVRAWLAFCRRCLKRSGDVLPPEVGDLLAWSRLFRHAGTFGNYVSYVRLACELVGVSTTVFEHPSVKRAKVAIEKRGLFARRAPKFIRIGLLQQMVAMSNATQQHVRLVSLCMTSYAFLLRVPSEAIPICAHSASNFNAPVMTVSEHELVLSLPKRKNRRTPSVLRRRCWCQQCEATCPVHVLGPYFRALAPGEQPFVKFKPSSALRELRALLEHLQVPDAHAYRTHDLRRGHAEDLRINGATLGEILRAGDWKSPAFLMYLDQSQLELDRTVEAHLVDSSDEE